MPDDILRANLTLPTFHRNKNVTGIGNPEAAKAWLGKVINITASFSHQILPKEAMSSLWEHSNCRVRVAKLELGQWIHLQCVRPEFDPRVGKIPWRRERLSTPVFWPGEFHELYSPWGHKGLDMTEQHSLSLIFICNFYHFFLFTSSSIGFLFFKSLASKNASWDSVTRCVTTETEWL